MQNIFSLLRGEDYFWHYCTMVLLFLIDLQLLKPEVGVEKNNKKSVTQPKNLKPIGNEAELQYQYSFGKKNRLTSAGKSLFTIPGPLSFFC